MRTTQIFRSVARRRLLASETSIFNHSSLKASRRPQLQLLPSISATSSPPPPLSLSSSLSQRRCYTDNRSDSSSNSDNSSKEFVSSATTYYDLFPKTFPNGPPPKGPFSIDSRSLRAEFLKLQASTHPDLVGSTESYAKHKRSAEAASATLNHAHAVLQDPLQRAQYILSLRGHDLANDETAKLEDQELIMEVLEAREEIEAAEEEHHLDEMVERNNERVKDSLKVLEDCFARDDLEGATRETVRLRYWVNIKESLDGWEKGKPIVLVH